MYQLSGAIDLSNRTVHGEKQVWHHSRGEIRLMRGFVTSDFFPVFFLVPKTSRGINLRASEVNNRVAPNLWTTQEVVFDDA